MCVMDQTKPYIVTTTGGYGKIMTLNFQVTNSIHNVDLFFKQKKMWKTTQVQLSLP